MDKDKVIFTLRQCQAFYCKRVSDCKKYGHPEPIVQLWQRMVDDLEQAIKLVEASDEQA